MSGIARDSGKSRRHTGHGSSRPRSTWPHPDTWLFDAAVVLAVCVLPFVVGGRHPAGYAILSIAALIACVAWFAQVMRADDPRWTASIGDALLAVALLIGGIQLVTMSADMFDIVSPRLHDLLPAYSGGPWSLGTWRTSTLTPGETAIGLRILVAQAILALVIHQFVRSIEAVERVLTIVVVAATLIAVHGVIQFVGHEGHSFDVTMLSFHDEGGIVKAMFRNRNDFAGFLAIAAGPAAWFAFHRHEPEVRRGRRQVGGTRRRRSSPPHEEGIRLAVGLGILGIISFAVFASLARGGSLALVVAVAVSCGMLVRSGHIRPRAGLAVLVAASVVGIALEIRGMEQFISRMETVVDTRHQEKTFGRHEVWEAAWRTIREYPLTGTGVGSHGDVSPMMMPPTGSTHYVHAESSYLNLAVETGLPGLAVAVIAMGGAIAAAATAFVKGAPREKPAAAAITAGLVAGAVNGIGHFNWYVPAISTLLIILGTCAIRMAAPHAWWIPTASLPVRRWTAGAVVAVTAVMLSAVAAGQISAAIAEPKWEEAVRRSRSIAREARSVLGRQATSLVDGAQSDAESDARPATAAVEVEAIRREWATLLAALDGRIALLDAVVAAQPHHPRAWAELAIALCERFGLARRLAEEPITLLDIRQVATSGGFADRAAFDVWLRSIAGDDLDDLVRGYDAAKRAVMNAPCTGDAWCVLAALSFLESFDAELPRRCIAQALVVRPHDGTVLYEAARQAELDGDEEEARRRRRRCFAVSAEHRDMIVALLLPTASAEQAVDLLQPDLAGLRTIDAAWSRQSTSEEMRPIRGRRLAAVLEAVGAAPEAHARATLLLEAATIQRSLGELEAALATLQSAVDSQPANYQAHLALADLAMHVGEHDVARRELEWCRLRRPDSKALHTREATLARLQAEGVRPVSYERPSGRPSP